MQNNIQFLLANNESLQHYLSQVKSTEPLTLEEEQALGHRIMAGDRKALHQLVEANLRFILKCINDMNIYVDVPIEELIAAGNYGLTIAATRYDPANQNRFCSYAVHYIYQAIRESINDWVCQISMPDSLHGRYICLSLDETHDEDEDSWSRNLIDCIPSAPMGTETYRQMEETKDHLRSFLTKWYYPNEVKLLMEYAQMKCDGYTTSDIAKKCGLPEKKMKTIIAAYQKKAAFNKIHAAYKKVS